MNGVIARVGRPAAITGVEVVLLERALKYGATVTEACQYAGIGRTTYYDELARNDDFAYKMACAKSYITRQAKVIVADRILIDHDPKMAMWFLSHYDPDYR